jgi:lipopolysaccharide/colanic/teichoic acid biosynthesis glycosyltransferase
MGCETGSGFMAQRLELDLRDQAVVRTSFPESVPILAKPSLLRSRRAADAADPGPHLAVPHPMSGFIEPPLIAASALVVFLVIAAGSGVIADPAPPGFAAAAGLTALTVVLVFLADGLTAGAFASIGGLTRALAGAASIGIGVVMGLRWMSPRIFSGNVPITVLIAFGLVGLVVQRSSVAGRPRAGCPRTAIVVADGEEDEPAERTRAAVDVRIVGRIAAPVETRLLHAALAAHRPEMVLVTAQFATLNLKFVRTCALFGARILVLAQPLFGLAAGVPIVRVGGLPWVALRPLALTGRHRRMKRTLDLGLVCLSIPIVVPLMMTVGVTVAVTSRGGVLFRQVRVGEGGRPFVLLKFRSMLADAEQESGPVLASTDDPRVTTVGRLLRRTHLDELPQLWNILRGQMSLVGPRPERPEFVSGYRAVRDYEARTLLRPGLTGLAQLVAGYSATPADKLRCDLLYLTSYSLRLDLRLLAATARNLLKGFLRG